MTFSYVRHMQLQIRVVAYDKLHMTFSYMQHMQIQIHVVA